MKPVYSFHELLERLRNVEDLQTLEIYFDVMLEDKPRYSSYELNVLLGAFDYKNKFIKYETAKKNAG